MATTSSSKNKKPANEKSKKSALIGSADLVFLENLINTQSPTGFEYTGQQVRMDYITPYVDEVFTDNYGTAVAVINPDAPYKVVIEAHCDEISRFVNYISND